MINPIETVYKGYRFRSRLEARWAVFFDALGINWEYEKEGLDIGGKYYLPDFYLSDIDTYIEIKPATLSEDKWPDHIVFDYISNSYDDDSGCYIGDHIRFVLIYGNPYLHNNGYDCEIPDDWEYEGYVMGDRFYRFCECPVCGKIGIEFDGRAARICGRKCLPDSDKSYNVKSDRLMNAYKKARQARFEHGENP